MVSRREDGIHDALQEVAENCTACANMGIDRSMEKRVNVRCRKMRFGVRNSHLTRGEYFPKCRVSRLHQGKGKKGVLRCKAVVKRLEQKWSRIAPCGGSHAIV